MHSERKRGRSGKMCALEMDDEEVTIISEHKRRPRHHVGTNLQSSICCCSNNKALTFLSSVVLFSFCVYLTSIVIDSRSGYYPSWGLGVGRRYGLGAGDIHGELTSALRRKGDGRASVAIIRVVGGGGGDAVTGNATGSKDDGGVRYLVQMKSHDYPIVAFRGTVCLLGGNANTEDATPLNTLKRELGEELYHPKWVSDLGVGESGGLVDASRETNKSSTSGPSNPGTIRFLGAAMHFQSSQLLDQPKPYAFLCALYEITIGVHQLPPGVINPRGANVREGRTVLLTEDQLVRHSRYAWGYEHTIEKYFGWTVSNKQVGAAVSDIDDRTWRGTVWTPGK